MSKSTIKLAFRDIKNKYKSFIYLLIILSGLSFLFIPLFSSIYRNYINENELKPSPFNVDYIPVVTSLEKNAGLSKLTKDLDELYAKDMFTYFNSSKLSEDFGDNLTINEIKHLYSKSKFYINRQLKIAYFNQFWYALNDTVLSRYKW